MKTLETTFKRQCFDYNMVFRNQVAAILEQKLEGEQIAYEVIRIQIYPDRKLNGTILAAGEYYPNSSQWGYEGWTKYTYTEAMKRLMQIRPVQKNK